MYSRLEFVVEQLQMQAVSIWELWSRLQRQSTESFSLYNCPSWGEKKKEKETIHT